VAYTTDENGHYKRTVRCTYCYEVGHNKLSCPQMKQDSIDRVAEYENQLKEDKFSDDWERNYAQRQLNHHKAVLEKRANRGKNRKCSYCKEVGHTRRTCSHRKTDVNAEAFKVRTAREAMAPLLEEQGIGVGALIKYDDDIYTVERMDWNSVDHGAVIGQESGQYCKPIVARSFPTKYHTRGRVCTFFLPVSVTNVNNEEVPQYSKDRYVILSQAPTASLPADFTDEAKCKEYATKLEKFNDGERPYEYWKS
jgi:hypothetical protein